MSNRSCCQSSPNLYLFLWCLVCLMGRWTSASFRSGTWCRSLFWWEIKMCCLPRQPPWREVKYHLWLSWRWWWRGPRLTMSFFPIRFALDRACLLWLTRVLRRPVNSLDIMWSSHSAPMIALQIEKKQYVLHEYISFKFLSIILFFPTFLFP